MVRMMLCACFLSSLLLVACSTQEAPPEPPPDPQVLMQADLEFARDTKERGVDGWVSWFAEDGAQLVPGREARGHEAIREIMTPAFAEPHSSLRWEPTFADIAESGDMGYTIGRYRSRRVDENGKQIDRTGTYTSIWRKNADGQWKVVLDSGVPDPEPEP